jgi:hypothetical protein
MRWLRHLVCVATLVALAGSASAAPAPLEPAQRAALAAIGADPPPPKIIGDTHFFVSDEVYPERFREALADRGGIFVGVGAEQNYLFAAWSKAELLVLVDFDQLLVDLHDVYLAFFRAAPDIDAFIALWADGEPRALDAMKSAAASHDDFVRMEYAHRLARPLVYARLVQARKRYNQAKVATFLNDTAQYEHLAGLVAAGRARSIRGDLTGKKTMHGLADAAKKIGLPLRGLYLSNVEQYFDYQSGLGDNLLAQPIDERSLFLRTFFKADGSRDPYRYFVQSAADARAWLAEPGVTNVVELLARARPRRQTSGAWLVPGP